jgi:hypothetical protein
MSDYSGGVAGSWQASECRAGGTGKLRGGVVKPAAGRLP